MLLCTVVYQRMRSSMMVSDGTAIRKHSFPVSESESEPYSFVCATSSESGNIKRLRDYDLPGTAKEALNFTIVQAALATSAASTFFDQVKIGDRFFRDGATGANNPVFDVWNEAQDLWDNEEGQLHDIVGCVLSVGTGDPGMIPLEEKSWKFLSKSLVAIATDTESQAERFGQEHRALLKQNNLRYYRWSVQQGLQDVGLEEFKKKGQIEAATEKYMRPRERKVEVQTCAEVLRDKKCMLHSLVSEEPDFS
jgi:hypothetical protein